MVKAFAILITVAIILPSCNTLKHLEDDESLVVENQVKIKSDERIKNKYTLVSELEAIAKLKPNRNFIGIPRQWFHYRTNKPEDTSGLKKFIRRVIAEPPAIYQEELVKESSLNMQNLLFNKGYFDAEVSYSAIIKKKRAQVIYEVDPHKRYVVDSLRFISRDTVLLKMANEIKSESFLSEGSPIDNGLYTREQKRFFDYFQNRGYAGFFHSHISPLIVDTSNGTNAVTIEILTPSDTSAHTKYQLGDTYIYVDYNPSIGPEFGNEESDKGLHFRSRADEFPIRTRIISRRVFFQKGRTYRRNYLEQTYESLDGMDNYKFVSISSKVDSLDKDVLDHTIFLTPSPKLGLGYNFNLFYATIDNQAQQLVGLSASGSVLSRNVFGGGENLRANVEAGIELNLANLRDPTSLRLRLQNGLELQRFIDHLGLFSTLRKIKIGKPLVSESFYEGLRGKANTSIDLAYEYNQFVDLYKYNLMQLALVTNFQKNRRQSYVYSPIGIEMYLPTVTERFEELNERNPNFVKEFKENRLFTGFILRNLNYIYRYKQPNSGNYNFFSLSAEFSGVEIFGLNSIVNLITSNNNVWKLDTIEISKYVRFEFDHRQYYDLGNNRQLAFRFIAGIAAPFGGSSVVPFIKQFTAGGGLSMRAWRARELGPGGDTSTFGSDPNRNFFQAGDIKLEANIEYRFPMYWIFNGALFVDVGNVWNLNPNDDDFPNGHITWNFLDQIAIGSGFGLRIDLSLFMLRLDWSYKIRSPFPVPDKGNRKWIFNSVQDLSFRNGTLQFGIDYPF
jgi:outer membrane protein insertion porin family